jgi:hypothetical protein
MEIRVAQPHSSVPVIAPAVLWLSHYRGPIRSGASCSVDPVGAGYRRLCGRLVDNRRPIGSDASRSVDPIGASGGVTLLGESKRAKREHDGE